MTGAARGAGGKKDGRRGGLAFGATALSYAGDRGAANPLLLHINIILVALVTHPTVRAYSAKPLGRQTDGGISALNVLPDVLEGPCSSLSYITVVLSTMHA